MITVLNQAYLDIPVVSLIADLDNVTNLWADKRASNVICPSEETRQQMLKAGMAPEQLVRTGFPVRSAFCTLQRPELRLPNKHFISILLISGSQGSAQVLKIARTLVHNKMIRLTIIAGHNTALKKTLEQTLAPYIGSQVTIYGFTSEVKARMMEADLLIIRASPNVLMEAVNLCKPVIVTGALRGQEAKNPRFVVTHQLGLYCRDVKDLPKMIAELSAHGGEKLRQIAENQYHFRKPESARVITERIIQIAKAKNSSQDRPIA